MQEQKIAVFPGSFDPLTNGHCDIIARALPLFDKIIIAIGRNSEKNCMFSLEERMDFVRRTYADQPKIEVTNYEGMTVDFCRSIGVKFMLRGLRNPSDFEFEKAIAQTNRRLCPDIETVFLFPWAAVVSRIGMQGLLSIVFFIAVLILGLAYAWRKGALEWK